MSEAVLSCKMQPRKNDAGAKSVGDYLLKLLETLWIEGEGFSGKRPFGNSGWEMEIAAALINGKLLTGSLGSDGYIESYDKDEFNGLMANAIETMKKKVLG